MKKKDDAFEKPARLIKEEGEDVRAEIRKEVHASEKRTQRKMDEGFSEVNRRLDNTIQPQLDNHAHRIKTLETRVSSR